MGTKGIEREGVQVGDRLSGGLKVVFRFESEVPGVTKQNPSNLRQPTVQDSLTRPRHR